MDFTEYQRFAESTAIYPPERGFSYTALGLCGEAGESAEIIKKFLRDDDGTGTAELSPDRRSKLAFELGDVLWYVANLAREAGLNLDEVAELNVLKLTTRQRADKLKGDGDDR